MGTLRLAVLLLAVLVPGPGPGAESSFGPAASRYGLLWLEVEPPDAHVALDGEYLDRGVWLISVRPGLHDLAVRKEGFRPYTRRLGVGPGESLRLSVRLERGTPGN